MGFLEKLFGKKKEEKSALSSVRMIDEKDDSKISHTLPISVSPVKQRYIIKSEGAYLIYNSVQDMDPELRKEIETVEVMDEMRSTYTVIVDGKKTIYSHFNDIPEEIRTAIEKSSDSK